VDLLPHPIIIITHPGFAGQKNQDRIVGVAISVTVEWTDYGESEVVVPKLQVL